MEQKQYDLVGIGSAIVDILSYKPEEFLEKNQLPVGSMTLIDLKQANSLYKQLGAATECSGGSCANSISAYALLGGNAAFIGKTKQDYLGKVFKEEIEKVGVDLITNSTQSGVSTSKCIILVTEEELSNGKRRVERTMATYLDFDVTITPEDIDENVIKQAKLIFFEGYLFDGAQSKKAVEKAIDIAKRNNTKIAFTLSDEDLRKIMHLLVDMNCTFCVTKGENGSMIFDGGSVYNIDPFKVEDVYDVTGAGDLYAAGVLFGLANNYSIPDSGKIGSYCAAEVIKDIGARPFPFAA